MKKTYTYRYDRNAALKVLSKLDESKTDIIKDDLVRTRSYVNELCDEYETPRVIERVKFAFLIPTRASRFNTEFWEEVYELLPALRHLNVADAYRVLISLPPFRIEMYGSPGEPSSGVLIFVPIFNDMVKDYRNKLLLLRAATKRINEAVSFTKRAFGVEYVGLGATLPGITKFGKKIKADVITTTGHAGTTYFIKKTVESVINDRFNGRNNVKIGFLGGGGSIGLAAMTTLAVAYPEAEFLLYDVRQKKAQKARKKIQSFGKKVTLVTSSKDLLKKSELIVSAVTTPVGVDGVDLAGKVIVDDSQPGSFERQAVIDGGGELIWVIGKDTSNQHIVTRRQQYSYGPHGLHHEYDIWGCEAEVSAIAYFDRPDLALTKRVTDEDVEKIGELFEKIGFTTAEYQSHGQLND